MARLPVVALALVVLIGGVITAHADIMGTNVSASMQILASTGPDIGQSSVSATAASVNLTQAGTGMNVQSSMVLSSLTPHSAVFDFTIGMHGNGYSVIGPPYYYPYLGIMANGNHTGNGDLPDGLFFRYLTGEPTTATVHWDFYLTGTNVFGMLPVYFYNPLTLTMPAGGGPVPGHYTGSMTFDLSTGSFPYFEVAFNPNVNGPAVPGPNNIGAIDGQYQGRFTFDFTPQGAPAPVPEPASFLALLTGIGPLMAAPSLRGLLRRRG